MLLFPSLGLQALGLGLRVWGFGFLSFRFGGQGLKKGDSHTTVSWLNPKPEALNPKS